MKHNQPQSHKNLETIQVHNFKPSTARVEKDQNREVEGIAELS